MSASSSESGDSDPLNGWTLVNSDGESENSLAGDTSSDSLEDNVAGDVLRDEPAGETSRDEHVGESLRDEPVKEDLPILDLGEDAPVEAPNADVFNLGTLNPEEPLPMYEVGLELYRRLKQSVESSNVPEAAAAAVEGHPRLCRCGQSTPLNGSDRSSDIELIPDDGSQENGSIVEDDAFSHASSYSLMNDSATMDASYPFVVRKRAGLNADPLEAELESLSSHSNVSAVQEVQADGNLSRRDSSTGLDAELQLIVTKMRSYTHKPNNRLNLWLSFLVGLTVTLVFGLGIGHFLGWSSRWIHQQQLHKMHIANLKDLQGELVQCLQHPGTLYHMSEQKQPQPCIELADFWQSRFDEILSENRVLQNFVDNSDDDDDDKKFEESDTAMEADYRKLKFHHLKRQLAKIKAKKLAGLTPDEMDEVMNMLMEELAKDRISLETVHDAVLEREKQVLVMWQLEDENTELKRKIGDSRVGMTTDDKDANVAATEQQLQETIDQLKMENVELKEAVFRLGYNGSPIEPSVTPQKGDTGDPQPAKPNESSPPLDSPPTSDSPTQTSDPSSLPPDSSLPEAPDARYRFLSNDAINTVLSSWLLNSFDELNLAEFLAHLKKVATDQPTAQAEILQLRDRLLTGYNQLTEHARSSLDGGRQIAMHLMLYLDAWHNGLTRQLSAESLQQSAVGVLKYMDGMFQSTINMLESDDTAAKVQDHIDSMVNALQLRFESVIIMWEKTMATAKMMGLPTRSSEILSDDLIRAARVDSEAKRADIEAKRARKMEKEHEKMGKEREKMEKEHESGSEVCNLRRRDQSSCEEDGKEEEGSPIVETKFDVGKNAAPVTVDEATNTNHHANYNDEMDRASCPKSDESENTSRMVEAGRAAWHQLPVDDDDDDDDDDDTEDASKVKPKTDKAKMDVENTTSSGGWVFERADGRKSQRHSKRRGDWIFERAQDRQQARKKIERAEWYFDRARGRYEQRVSDKAMQKSDEKLAKKRDKQRKKENKRQKRSESDSDSDDDEAEEKRDKRKKSSKSEQRRRRDNRHHHHKAFDWAVPFRWFRDDFIDIFLREK